MLEGPAWFMRTRFVPATGHGAVEAISAEEQQAYRETKLFKHELATRTGLPTRPQHELYDVVNDCTGASLQSQALTVLSNPRTAPKEPVARNLSPKGHTARTSRTPRQPDFRHDVALGKRLILPNTEGVKHLSIPKQHDRSICRGFKPSDGLEPSTPSLPRPRALASYTRAPYPRRVLFLKQAT